MENQQEAQAREAREEGSDMDMMLHERLRGAEGIGDLQYIVGCESNEEHEIYTALANEIERYYIPRPRFEDGEPVQFGDETDNLESVDIIEFRQDGTFQLGEKRESGLGTYIDIYEAGELVKRPTPKVCDADGAEIKIGDTVWCIDDEPERKWRVEEIHADKPLIHLYELDAIGDHSWGWVSAERFANERPVFDADGVRICKGDTVWHVCTGKKAIVTTVYRDDQTVVEVEIAGHLMDYEPSDLTHREPDSLEKLCDDISRYSVVSPHSTAEIFEWRDRLTALMERGA